MKPLIDILCGLFGDEFLHSVEFVVIAWLVTLRIMENDIWVMR